MELIKYFIIFTSCVWTYFEIRVFAIQESGTFYGFYIDKAIAGFDLYSVTVYSKLECAIYCLKDHSCTNAVTKCSMLDQNIASECDLKSVPQVSLNGAISTENGKCSISRSAFSNDQSHENEETTTKTTTVETTSVETTSVEETTLETTIETTTVETTSVEETTLETTIETTTVEATTSSGSSVSIVGVIGNLLNMCSSGSDKDIAIFTDSGIYIYNTMDDILTGSCFGGARTFASVFPGYTGDRPLLNQVDCVIGYETYVEVYASGKVWQWQVNSEGTTSEPYKNSYPKFLTGKLGSDPPTPSNPKWCTYRKRHGQDRYFYDSSGFIFKSDQTPRSESFTQEEDFYNQNNLHLNPWKQLPAKVIAVTSVDLQYSSYLVITSDGVSYSYVLNYAFDNNNPSISSNEHGDVALQ